MRISSQIDLKIFENLPYLSNLKLVGCEDVLNKDFYDNKDKIKVEIRKNYSFFAKENEEKDPYKFEHIYETGIEWVRGQIRSKGADSTMQQEWLFESFKDSRHIKIFTQNYIKLLQKK